MKNLSINHRRTEGVEVELAKQSDTKASVYESL